MAVSQHHLAQAWTRRRATVMRPTVIAVLDGEKGEVTVTKR